MHSLASFVLALIGATTLPEPVRHEASGDPVHVEVLSPGKTTCGENFGRRIDVEQDVAVVASPGAPAWVFERRDGAWVESARLGVDVGDTFGDEVAVWDEWVALAEPGASVAGTKRAGIVHLFRRGDASWDTAQRLEIEGASEGFRFGSVIAMDQGVLAVRAAGDRAFGADGPAGSVFVFELEGPTWTRRARLRRDHPGDAFGEALAVGAQRLLVGVPANSEFRGGAYLFERGDGDWSACHDLGGPHRFEGDFGRSLALDGDWAAVGSWGGVPDNADHGVALFREMEGAWIEVQRLELRGDGGPLRGPLEPWFGSGIALSGTDLVVSASLAEVDEVRRGAVVQYRLGADGEVWEEVGRILLPSDVVLGANGGWIALDGDRAWIGAPESDLHHDSPRCNSGAVVAIGLAR